MANTDLIIYFGLFITIIGLTVMNIIQKFRFHSEIKKKPLKDYLFPPVLPIRRSPKPKLIGRFTKSMPIIHV